MEFHQLRYACAVADTGSFSRAAEQCHIAQPSLSQQVLKLEEELGAKLFDRLGRTVRLTDAGRDDPLLDGFADGTPTFNAHRDFITAGPGAVVLARSDRAPVHALRAGGRVYGVQFHPEMDADRVARYANASQPGAYLRRHGWDPADLIALAEQHHDAHARMGRELADRWLDRIVAPV